MNMMQTIAPQAEFLYVDCSGEFALAEAQAQFVEIVTALAQHLKKEVLVDLRHLHGCPTLLDRYCYSEFAALSVITAEDKDLLGARFVYVGEAPLIDAERFGETVARNRGLNVRVYETKEITDAFAWLDIDPSSVSHAFKQRQ